MGSPISGISNFFLEFLESEPFKYNLPNDIHFVRYTDDILIIYPNKYNIEIITIKLNNIEPTIKPTHEFEKDNSLPFLDIQLINKNDELELKLHHKTNSRNDYIHYFSNHSDKIKRGVLIGFFLRALTICSPNHLNNKLDYLLVQYLFFLFQCNFINFKYFVFFQ